MLNDPEDTPNQNRILTTALDAPAPFWDTHFRNGRVIVTLDTQLSRGRAPPADKMLTCTWSAPSIQGMLRDNAGAPLEEWMLRSRKGAPVPLGMLTGS
jgi:hypothetical protein